MTSLRPTAPTQKIFNSTKNGLTSQSISFRVLSESFDISYVYFCYTTVFSNLKVLTLSLNNLKDGQTYELETNPSRRGSTPFVLEMSSGKRQRLDFTPCGHLTSLAVDTVFTQFPIVYSVCMVWKICTDKKETPT